MYWKLSPPKTCKTSIEPARWLVIPDLWCVQARSMREDGTRRQGSAAARRLFMVRRVERNLMSYERTGAH